MGGGGGVEGGLSVYDVYALMSVFPDKVLRHRMTVIIIMTRHYIYDRLT